MAATRHEEPPRRILVTGVGGAPGLDLARALIHRDCQIIGTDANPLAPGLLLPGITPRLTPAASDPSYGAALLQACRDLEPDAAVPCIEGDLPWLVRMRNDLRAAGVRTWLPDGDAVEACIDKWAFTALLDKHGIPVPRSFLPHEIDTVPDGARLVVKPRRGHGSQSVHFCSTRKQAKVLCELVPDPIVQEHVGGREFTADCLVDHAGCASVILRYRLLVKGGLSVVSETFHNPEAAQRVRETLTAAGAAGICCVQGFITGDPERPVVVTELNPRIAGAFGVSEVAGADLVGQFLNGLFDLPVDHNALSYAPGIRVTKYVETLATSQREEGMLA